MHDIVAELAGYRAELAHAEQYGNDKRAKAVRAEVERVEEQVRERAEKAEALAADLYRHGQAADAAQADTKRYRAALGEDKANSPASATAADARPKETATTTRKRGA